MATTQVRTSLLVAGFLAFAATIGALLLQNHQLKQSTQIVIQYPPCPCSAFDKVYNKVKVKEVGTLCIEKKTKDWIKNILKKGEVWEPHVAKRLKQYVRPGTTVVDIGAHIGTHTLLMSRLVGPKGRVVAFEPQVKIYQELLVNLQLNNITNTQTYFTALGERPRRITMSYPNEKNEGHIFFGPGGNIVEIRTLDSFHLSNVSLIKIDVEGAENYVLRGARKTIATQRPAVLIEIVGGVRRSQMNGAQKRQYWTTLNWFKSLRYDVIRIAGYDYIALPKESKEYKALVKKLEKTLARSRQPITRPIRPAPAKR